MDEEALVKFDRDIGMTEPVTMKATEPQDPEDRAIAIKRIMKHVGAD